MKAWQTGPETPRLLHRAFCVEDAEVFLELRSNPQVIRYTGDPPMTSITKAREAIESYPDFETIGYGRWACIHKADQKVIGFCGLKYLDDLKAVDVGYRFLPEYWGKGLATEACQASIDFGFRVLSLPVIIGLVMPENAGSIRVLEKAGMKAAGESMYGEHKVLKYRIENPDDDVRGGQDG